ncbi:hypothetical protein EC988_005811 [Linderina pennispora]|nr:hypothetical protein EC988_005811 [Linderina pennispora]
MFKIKSLLLTLALACVALISLTAYTYRDEFQNRDITNLANERDASADSGGFFPNLFGGSNDGFDSLWAGDSHVVMGKLGNETLRAQLGRRTWYLLHVMASRYPPEPTKDEVSAMKNFLFLMSRLYPCGDCAHHFQQHLKKHPPVASSRDELEQYLCRMHNTVNKVLKKPQFDCATVHDNYDCGCGPDNVRYKPDGTKL